MRRTTVRTLVAAAVLACAQAAQAQSAAELRARAREITADIAAQEAGKRFDSVAQQRAVERLGPLALGFIALSDRTSAAGAEGREREALSAAYDAVSAPLESLYDTNSGALDRMAKGVMDEDGDLEALYETPAFKNAQLVASQALYYLNWLHYYGARLREGAARKALLEKAQRGFSEFAVGDRRSDLLVESLLGRGLCHLELGNIDFALHDLQAVATDAQASPERRAKARLGTLDAYARAGRTADALRVSDELLRDGDRSDDDLVRFLRARVLLAAAKGASGAEADRYRQQALVALDQLRTAGPGWETKVAGLLQTQVDNPARWADKAASPFAKWELAKMLVQKGDYKQATPLLEAVVASSDPALRSAQGEAQYMLGLARFQAGQYQAAADHLDAALGDEQAAYAADAAYMRFKVLEALVAQSPDGGFGPRYEQAVRAFLARHPDHRATFEAHFRLGELLQGQRQFEAALQSYARVQGDPGFELRARFASLQCRFELLQAAEGLDAPRRAAVVKEISDDLRAVDAQLTASEKQRGGADPAQLKAMRAKTAVMRAVYAGLQAEPDDPAIVEALAGFEAKYTDQADLLPQVWRLRLGAYLRLGRFADAATEVKAHGPALLAAIGQPAIEDLAVAFIREGARRNGQGDATANRAAEQVALRLYELLPTEGEGVGKTRLTLARLYENTGDLAKARPLYAASVQTSAAPALRGLARIAEREQRPADAIGYWRQLGTSVRAGDPPWYESQYEVARVTLAMGQQQASCEQLKQLKPAMPGLSDADLRKKFDALYKQACG